jgi:AcrR family transcriptional regulator
MGTLERRERERQETHQRILNAARDIAVQHGWEKVTIRKIADQVEYSPATIYEYFESKDAILLGLLREGFQRVLHILQSTRERTQDPIPCLMAMVGAYWDFAWSNPELYQVMHGLDGVPFGSTNPVMEAKAVFVIVREVLQTVLQQGEGAMPDLDSEVEILWSMLHGVITLTMAGRIVGGREQGRRLFDLAIDHLLVAWNVRHAA